MLRNEYFVECIQASKFRELNWILSILAVTDTPYKEDIPVEEAEPYKLYKAGNEHYHFFDPVSKEYVDIEDSSTDGPMFGQKDYINIPGGTINVPPNVKTLRTTIGNVLINACTLFFPFGTLIPFMNGGKTIDEIDRINPNAMTKEVTSRVYRTPKRGKPAPLDPTKHITVPQLRLWMQAVTWMSGLATITTGSLTEKSIGIDPAILKRRDELYEQYKDLLGNPAIQAKIEEELIKMDMESLKDDPSFDFYYKYDKHWATSRKKQLITTGLMSSITGEANFIAAPLIDGIDAENIPQYSDAIRHASYSRGHLTALGGELVKYIFRVTQNIKITEPDCGTKFGLSDTIVVGYEKLYIGRYYLNAGNSVEITNENVGSLVNKLLYLRSPAYCKTRNGNFCEMCMGKDLSMTPNALHTAAAQPGSVMMNASMKAMHGKASKTVRFDYRTAMT